jgi:transposase
MTFIRRVKVGKHIYLREVKSVWENGKPTQKFIRHIGKEIDGKRLLNGSIAESEISKVSIYGPLLLLNEIAKQINLHEILGEYSSEILSMVYSHCIDPKSLNKMEEWFSRTELNNLLNIKELTERRLVDSLDKINCEERAEILQDKIFEAVNSRYKLQNNSFFYDVTNIYFFGANCKLAKRGKSKEGGYKKIIQIGLAVTKEGIPIFHKTFSGDVFDARTLFDVMKSLSIIGINDPFLIWDRGVSSKINIADAKKLGFEVICGLANKGKMPEEVDEVINNSNFLRPRNRVQLKNSSFYVSVRKHNCEGVSGYLYVCLNKKQQLEQQEKRLNEIEEAKQLLEKNKSVEEPLRKFFRKKILLENKVLEAEKYDGISIIFSTKSLEPKDILKRYFEKDVVEKAFTCLKGVIKVRPVRKWIEERVRAHIFICYLSYLLLSILDYKLEKKFVPVSAIEAVNKLETMYKIYITDPKTKNEFVKTVVLTKIQEKILRAVSKKLIEPSDQKLHQT